MAGEKSTKKSTKKTTKKSTARPIKKAPVAAPEIPPESSRDAGGEAIGFPSGGYHMTKVEQLREAVSIARAFANLADSLLALPDGDKFGTALSGAVTRRSMDLTRALAEYRKS